MSPVLRRVLVGFDGSEPSRDALELALRLVDPEGGDLLLVNLDEHRAFRVLVRHRGRGTPRSLGAHRSGRVGSILQALVTVALGFCVVALLVLTALPD